MAESNSGQNRGIFYINYFLFDISDQIKKIGLKLMNFQIGKNDDFSVKIQHKLGNFLNKFLFYFGSNLDQTLTFINFDRNLKYLQFMLNYEN